MKNVKGYSMVKSLLGGKLGAFSNYYHILQLSLCHFIFCSPYPMSVYKPCVIHARNSNCSVGLVRDLGTASLSTLFCGVAKLSIIALDLFQLVFTELSCLHVTSLHSSRVRPVGCVTREHHRHLTIHCHSLFFRDSHR